RSVRERRQVPRPRRRILRRYRLGLRSDPGAERDRQLDQGRAAASGQDRARFKGACPAPAPRRPVDGHYNRHLGEGRALMDRAATAPAAMPWGLTLLAGLVLAFSNFMVVLDMTIANVSVPHIAGSLGISSSEGTWVITSYAVAE